MPLNEVFAAPEAAILWKLDKKTVNQKCIDSEKGIAKKPFLSKEYRKSGGTWLVTKKGMERMYGKLPEEIEASQA